jgi:hypothetical protein
MNDIKIINTDGALAYVLPSQLDTIFIQIPKKVMLDSETLRVYNTNIQKWITVNMINEILNLLEHESLHIVLNKTVSVEASCKLDNPIDNETLETMRYREQWENYEGVAHEKE